MSGSVRDISVATDPVAAVLEAYTRGEQIALRTSGTTTRPRSVLRTAASWVKSFPSVSRLTGIGPSSRVWVPGPLASTMNLFAASHARFVGAELLGSAVGATHACVTPAALAQCLDDGADLGGVHVIAAGDRLVPGLAERAKAAGARVSHYYGAAELSFVAWGSHEQDLRVFPGVEVEIREGQIWVRSPYLSLGYRAGSGPFRATEDGFATVGDRGSLSGGVLTVAGRGVAAVLTGAATVLVDDVEQALRRISGGEVVVVGVPHRRLGQVVGAVLTDRSTLARVREAARTDLAPAQRPRLWFHLPQLPVTSAGKLDRGAVLELVLSGRLAPVAPGAMVTDVARSVGRQP